MFLCNHQRFLKLKILNMLAETRMIRSDENNISKALSRRDKARNRMAAIVAAQDRDYTEARQAIIVEADLDQHPARWEWEAKSRQGELRLHRITILRREMRASFLAYAFLRGKTLESVEGSTGCDHGGTILRASRIVKTFGTMRAVEVFHDWVGLPKPEAVNI